MYKKAKKIVITGGPCAGKSKIIERIKQEYKFRVIVVPEVATLLLSVPYAEGGIGVPGKDLEWSQEWQDEFQARIVAEQLRQESMAERQAIIASIVEPVIVCDRGILDGAAYLSGGVREFCERYGLDYEKCLAMYDQVIHLNSLATDEPQIYEELKDTNPGRFEDPERARMLDERLREIWGGHRNHSVVPVSPDIEEKSELCIQMVGETLGAREKAVSRNLGTDETVEGSEQRDWNNQ